MLFFKNYYELKYFFAKNISRVWSNVMYNDPHKYW